MSGFGLNYLEGIVQSIARKRATIQCGENLEKLPLKHLMPFHPDQAQQMSESSCIAYPKVAGPHQSSGLIVEISHGSASILWQDGSCSSMPYPQALESLC